jgi:hypothetical protein
MQICNDSKWYDRFFNQHRTHLRQRVRSSAIVPNQQEQTVMGTTADKIAGKIGSQLRSKIIDLSGLRAAKDIFEEAQLDVDGLCSGHRAFRS